MTTPANTPIALAARIVRKGSTVVTNRQAQATWRALTAPQRGTSYKGVSRIKGQPANVYTVLLTNKTATTRIRFVKGVKAVRITAIRCSHA